MKQLDCTALQKHIIPPLPRVFDEKDVENDEKTNFEDSVEIWANRDARYQNRAKQEFLVFNIKSIVNDPNIARKMKTNGKTAFQGCLRIQADENESDDD